MKSSVVKPRQAEEKGLRGNRADLGVCLPSMPVNWIGQVAIRVLIRRSRGDFQPIDAPNPRAGRPHPLALRSLRPGPLLLAPFSWPGEGGSLLWGTPPHPPARTSPLQPFPGFPRSDVLACGRPSLVRYYAHTEQVPLNLNTYPERLQPHKKGYYGSWRECQILMDRTTEPGYAIETSPA